MTDRATMRPINPEAAPVVPKPQRNRSQQVSAADKPRRPTQRDTERLLKAAIKAGVAVGEVRMEIDGSIRVITSDRRESPADEALLDWERSRASRKA